MWSRCGDLLSWRSWWSTWSLIIPFSLQLLFLLLSVTFWLLGRGEKNPGVEKVGRPAAA